jgi:MFS family permease
MFLGLRSGMAGLLGMVVLVGMGERMAERFLPVYLIALGGGVMSVGLLNGLDNLLSALYSFPGGYLAQKLGAKKSLLIFNLLAMVGFVIVIAIPRWEAVIGASFLFLSWTAISLPATMSIVARVLPRNKRTMGVSMHSLVRRVPMALGPLTGGALISAWGVEAGVRAAFAAALALAILALYMQQRLIDDDPGGAGEDGVNVGLVTLLRGMPRSLRSLLMADILVRFCEQIPYAFVVIWCMNTATSPVTAFQFGVLTTVEMVTAVLIYIPVAYYADKTGKKPFVVMTFIFFTLFPLALMFCHSFWPLVAVFILRGLKEFGEPTRKALIMDLAPENTKAASFGAYYLARDSVVSVAAFSGAWFWNVSPQVNLIAAFAFGVMGTLWFMWKGSDMEASAADLTGEEA